MKLDDDAQQTKRNCTDPTLILGHTVYLSLTLQPEKKTRKVKSASIQGAWLSPSGQTKPLANNTKPRRRARPLWRPDLARLSAFGRNPAIFQNEALQGHH